MGGKGKKRDRSEVNEARQLIQLAEDSGLEDADLDDEIHDVKSHEASDINNQGREVQVKYLYECFGRDETKKIIERVAELKKILDGKI